jgi:hypothetical protein
MTKAPSSMEGAFVGVLTTRALDVASLVPDEPVGGCHLVGGLVGIVVTLGPLDLGRDVSKGGPDVVGQDLDLGPAVPAFGLPAVLLQASAVRGASAARVRSGGRMVRRGTSRPVGSPSVPAPRSVDLDGRRRCETNRKRSRGSRAQRLVRSPHGERQTAAMWPLGDVRPLSGDNSWIQGDGRDDVPDSKVTSQPARDAVVIMEEVTLEVTRVRTMSSDQGASSWYRTKEAQCLRRPPLSAIPERRRHGHDGHGPVGAGRRRSDLGPRSGPPHRPARRHALPPLSNRPIPAGFPDRCSMESLGPSIGTVPPWRHHRAVISERQLSR